MKNLKWQWYWRGWQCWSFDYCTYHDADYPTVQDNFLILGPLQFRWYSSCKALA